jgi:segregation and condensation protein A
VSQESGIQLPPAADGLFIVRQDSFTGTLRELGSALRSERLAPSAVDLLQLVRSWLEHYGSLAAAGLDEASEALPGVAQVIELKLRLLLPRPPRETAEAEDLTDVLEAVAFLEELDVAIDFLRQRREQRRVLLPATAPRPALKRRQRPESLAVGTLTELASRLRSHSYFELVPDAIDVAAATRLILDRLAPGTPALLGELVGSGDWPVITVFFAALLELVREGRIEVRQAVPFAPLEVRLTADSEPRDPASLAEPVEA